MPVVKVMVMVKFRPRDPKTPERILMILGIYNCRWYDHSYKCVWQRECSGWTRDLLLVLVSYRIPFSFLNCIIEISV